MKDKKPTGNKVSFRETLKHFIFGHKPRESAKTSSYDNGDYPDEAYDTCYHCEEEIFQSRSGHWFLR